MSKIYKFLLPSVPILRTDATSVNTNFVEPIKAPDYVVAGKVIEDNEKARKNRDASANAGFDVTKPSLYGWNVPSIVEGIWNFVPVLGTSNKMYKAGVTKDSGDAMEAVGSLAFDVAGVGTLSKAGKAKTVTNGFGDAKVISKPAGDLAPVTDAFNQRLNNGAIGQVMLNGDPSDLKHLVNITPSNDYRTTALLMADIRKLLETKYPGVKWTDKEVKGFLDRDIHNGGYTAWNLDDLTVNAYVYPTYIEEKYTVNPEYAKAAINHHETNHMVHSPSTAEGFNSKADPSEMSSLFTELKDFNKVTDPKTELTPEMFYNFRDNYLKQTGLNPNRYGFIDKIIDLPKALKWGKNHSLSVFPIGVVGIGTVNNEKDSGSSIKKTGGILNYLEYANKR